MIRFVLAAALAAAGGLAFVPLAEPRALVVVPLAAAGAAGVGAVRGRWSLPLAVVAWAAAGIPAALALGVGNATVAQTVRGGLVDGFRVALTSALPLPASPSVLFWIFTLVWWAAYWAARGLVVPLLAPLPPALLLLTGTALGVGGPGRGYPAAAMFAGVAVLLLGVREKAGAGRVVAAAATSLLVTAGAVAMTSRLPGRPEFDPRALVHQPREVRRQLNPFALAALWVTEPPRPVLRVATDAPVNLRLAVFDDYDGHDWTSRATYVSAGARLPGTAAGRPVQDVISVDGLPLAWLPAPDRPTAVTGTSVRVDRGTGVLTTADGGAATGRTYAVTSRVPVFSASDAVRATPESGPSYATALAVPPGVPASLLRDADRLTADDAVPYQRLLALQSYLRANERYDAHAAPGRTLGHLRFFYDRSHQGTADQFATVFALMARHLGMPARVVIGFAPGRRAGAGRYQVATTDVAIWPEVALRGLGWVPFYPVPRASSGAATVGRSTGEPPGRAAVDQAVAAARAAPPARRPDAAPAPGRHRRTPYWPAALLPVLLCGYLLSGPAVRARARRRRRSGGPYDRVVGGWQEAVGLLARLPGADGLAAMTAEEIRDRAGHWLGHAADAELATLSARLSTAVFSGRPPNESDAATVWRAVGRLRRAVRRRLGLAGCIRWFLRPPWPPPRRKGVSESLTHTPA